MSYDLWFMFYEMGAEFDLRCFFITVFTVTQR
jgi:hypothetical protein